MYEDIARAGAERTLDHLSRSRFPEHIHRIWPLLVVALGLFATVAWIALLGWGSSTGPSWRSRSTQAKIRRRGIQATTAAYRCRRLDLIVPTARQMATLFGKPVRAGEIHEARGRGIYGP